MNITRVKMLTVALFAVPVLFVLLSGNVPAGARPAEDFDAAAAYKAKCAMCHGQKAEKKFDAAKDDAGHVEAILKGRDSTPKMPGYETKGVTAAQAQAFVTYMKSLKQ
jgi:mono/diheme cytochrome c family protein